MNKARVISILGRVPILSHGLRWLAARYPEGSVTPIRAGLAEGLRWRRSHRYVNGYWTGQYELPMQQALGRLLKPGDTFFDVGANAGFFSLIATHLVGPSGTCVSVDPDPFNTDQMRQVASLNGISRWTILQKAVAERPGRLRFSFGQPGDAAAHLDDAPHPAHLGGQTGVESKIIEVEVATLDDLWREYGTPKVVKLDVEGAEVRALEGAGELLAKARPVWVIELHSAQLAERVRAVLKGAGYHFSALDDVSIPDSKPLEHHVIARPE